MPDYEKVYKCSIYTAIISAPNDMADIVERCDALWMSSPNNLLNTAGLDTAE